MITINKKVSITIDGDDVQTLCDLCELARRHMGRMRTGLTVDEYSARRVAAMQDFLTATANA